MKKWLFFAIILPWMVRYGSKRSFLLIFSARDDLVKVSWKSDARKCQNQLTPPYFDQLSERSQPLSRKSLLVRRKVDGGVLDAIFDDWRPNGASFNQQPEDYFGRLASNRTGAALCPVFVKICAAQRITEISTLLSLFFFFTNWVFRIKVS